MSDPDENAEELDRLLDLVIESVHPLVSKYDMEVRDVVILLDTLKSFAGEYHKLVVDGRVPKNRLLTHDLEKALDAINEVLGDEEI